MKRECVPLTSVRLLDAGSGATTLIDALLDRGYANLIAVDISEVALERLHARLDTKEAAQVQWIAAPVCLHAVSSCRRRLGYRVKQHAAVEPGTVKKTLKPAIALDSVSAVCV